MLVVSAASLLLLVAAYLLSRRSEDQTSLREPHAKMLRLGIQIICGDCGGESERPVKTYLDQFGRCVQCGGRAYVLATAYARHKMMGRRELAVQAETDCEWASDCGETTGDMRRESFGLQTRLHAVRINKVSA